MGRGRIVLAALLALTFSACASRPHGTLVATNQVAPGGSVVDLLVVTTREPDQSEPGVMFSGERGHGVHFADIAVSIPPDANRAVGDVQWPQAPPDPATQFTTVHADVLSRDAALAAFNARIRKTPRRQVLVFVHGFNTRFEEAVYRFAQIVHDSRADVTPVLFTWPSRGRLLQYGYDHESASYSRDALESVLQALQRDRDVGEISILAHSMGNWVTLEALRQMAIRNGQIGSKIQNVMLASPDVDFDVFRRQIAEIGGVRPSIFTLFASRDDDALAASRRFWGNTRLGAVDPKAPPYREVLDRDRVKVVDLTGIATSDPLEHSKFASSPQVVRSIGARLAQGQPLRDGQAGLGDHLGLATAGAVSAVGGVAGAAVAAPFAIVDPATRDNLGEHLGAATQHFDPQY